MSQLKEALKKKMASQFKNAGLSEGIIEDSVKRQAALIKEQRRRAEETAKLYRRP